MSSDNLFKIKVDSSNCKSSIEGAAFLGKSKSYDVWRYKDIEFESGKIYALVGEYGQGCMYLSYLLGGQIDFGDLKIYINNGEISKEYLESISWNLEPNEEKYRNKKVKKSIKKALLRNNSKEFFLDIQQKFVLTEKRSDRKLFQLSGERWRASAGLGYVENKKIFYAPYKASSFYYAMSQSGLIKALRELTDSGAIVLLPVGSDDFVKYIVDKCIYLKKDYNIDELKQYYKKLYDKENWIY